MVNKIGAMYRYVCTYFIRGKNSINIMSKIMPYEINELVKRFRGVAFVYSSDPRHK